MRSPGINGEGELRGQPANPGSPGKMAVKMECVCLDIPRQSDKPTKNKRVFFIIYSTISEDRIKWIMLLNVKQAHFLRV